MTIARVVAGRSSEVTSCPITMPVHEVIDLLAHHRIGAVPVLDGRAIAGIFSERDVVYRLCEHGPSLLDMPVARVMTSPAITVDLATPVLEALGLMTRRRIRHLPVVSAGAMVAFISIGDLVKYRIDKMHNEAEALREYIQTV
jgi:CBS domain-containing protein